MHIESYELKIQQWLNMIQTYKQAMRVMYSIVYGKCTEKMKQKLETSPEFSPIKDKLDHK